LKMIDLALSLPDQDEEDDDDEKEKERKPKELGIGGSLGGSVGIDIDLNKPKLGKEKEHCNVCLKEYSLFRKKKHCEECKKEICSSCSDNHKFSVLGWASGKLICKTCLPKFKLEIEEIGKKDPKKLEIARKESDSIDIAINKPTEPQVELGIGGSLGGSVGIDLDLNKPKLGKESKQCKVCLKPYTLFRKKKECERCGKEACTSCADHHKFSVLGWLSAKFVCKACLPEIKFEIDAKVKENPNLKAQAEKN